MLIFSSSHDLQVLVKAKMIILNHDYSIKQEEKGVNEEKHQDFSRNPGRHSIKTIVKINRTNQDSGKKSENDAGEIIEQFIRSERKYHL